MTKSIVFLNKKGGVGKTTSAFHQIHYALDKGLRVLAVDLDSQMNLTTAMVEDTKGLSQSAYLFLEHEAGECPAPSLITDKLSLYSGQPTALDVEKMDLNALYLFRENLLSVMDGFDLVVFDTSPKAGLSMQAPALFVDVVVVPMEMHLFSLEAFKQTNKFIDLCLDQNKNLQHVVAVANKCQPRTREFTKMHTALKQQMGDNLIDPPIQQRVAISTSTTEGLPVWKMSRKDKLAINEYQTVCKKIMGLLK